MKAELIKPVKSRIYYLDILRFIACIAVVFVHTSADFVSAGVGSVDFCVGFIVNGIARIGVPLFVMISGSLLLDEKYNYTREKLAGHIKKMVVFFVFWSLFYAVFYEIIRPVFLTHKQLDITGIVTAFFKGSTHLWFVYMIVGLYLILPLLRLWVKDENKRYVKYFLILAVIFSFVIPQLASIGSSFSSVFKCIDEIMENMNMKYIAGYTTYFILGWYLNNYELKNKGLVYILGIIGTIVTIGGTIGLSVLKGEEVSVYGNMTVNVLLSSVMMFVLARNTYKNKAQVKESKVVCTVSKHSLGIYAIHPFIISVISIALEKFGIDNVFVAIPVIIIGTLVVSFICSFVMSKLPLLKKVV